MNKMERIKAWHRQHKMSHNPRFHTHQRVGMCVLRHLIWSTKQQERTVLHKHYSDFYSTNHLIECNKHKNKWLALDRTHKLSAPVFKVRFQCKKSVRKSGLFLGLWIWGEGGVKFGGLCRISVDKVWQAETQNPYQI